MKILVISHTYIVDLNCEKLRLLAQLNPEIEVTVVVPQRWRPGGVQNQLVETKFRREGNFCLVPVANFSQNNQALLTFGIGIISLLKQFRPQIIQVEQGAKALSYAQLITLNRLLGIQAKNLFFTWWNLPYTSRFPVSWLEAYNLRHTDGAIAGNQDAANILHQHGYGGPMKVMPQLGVDETLFSPCPQPELLPQFGIKPDEFVIGFVGRFVVEKGLLTLIKAVAGLPRHSYSWKLLLLGRGTLQEVMVTEAKAAGIQDRLTIVESVPHDQVFRYINAMNVLVLPSETTYQVKTLTAIGWQEQFGHVLIEAMACQVPVIGSDSGEIPNVIDQAGLIFPEGDEIALRHCLQQIMLQPELAKTLAQQGYERAIAKYTNTALARELLGFYQELLS